MKKYKQIDKSLPKNYSDIAFSTVNSLRKNGCNRYEFRYIRDKVYLEAEKLYNEQETVDSFKRKLEQCATKYSSKASVKTKLELVCNFVFVLFAILSIVFPILYGVGFAHNDSNGNYSHSIYYSINLYNLFLMFMYFSIGALVASFLQKIDKKKKTVLMVITIGIEAVICASLYALSDTYPEFFLSINFVLFELQFIALAVAGYFIEETLAKKAFEKKHTN